MLENYRKHAILLPDVFKITIFNPLHCLLNRIELKYVH